MTDGAGAPVPEPSPAEPRRTPILRSFGFLTGGRILGDLSTFLFFVVVSRSFGQEGAGEYSLAMALAGLFVVFGDFGIYYYSIKELSRSKNSVMVDHSDAFIVRLILCVSAFVLLVMMLPFTSWSVQLKLLAALVGASQLAQVLVHGFAAVFVARGQSHLAGMLELLVKALGAAAGVAIIAQGGSLASAVTALPIVSLVVLALAYGLVRRAHGAISIQTSWRRLSRLLRAALPYALSELLRFVSMRTDVILLGLLVGPVAAGIYSVAFRLIWFPQVIANYAAIAILPEAARSYSQSKKEMRYLHDISLRTLVLVGIPGVAGLWLISSDLVVLIYGSGFSQSILILRLLSIVLFFSTAKVILAIFLTGADRQPKRTKIEWSTAGVNVAGNVVLIPIFGVIGATFAALLSEMLVVVLLAASLRSVVGAPRVLSRLGMSVVATSGFLGLVAALPDLPLAIEVLVCVITYGGILCLFADLRRNELRFVSGVRDSVARWGPSTWRASRTPHG